jgi:transmembrane sensor
VSTIANSEGGLPLPDSVRVEAAVWLARLHSDERSERTEAAFRDWLAASPTHRAAFERMTGVWESTSNLRRERTPPHTRELGRALRRVIVASAATLTVCALVTVGVLSLVRFDESTKVQVFQTAHGERRIWMLSDGSRLILNTNSRVKVAFSSRARRVTLETGQARFDVARNPARPFVVRAGGRQIIALGTTFDVHWTGDRLSIVLVEGRVAILPASASPMAATSPSASTLDAGERLELQDPGPAVKSVARLDREEAWVTDRVIFDSTRLGEAVEEINRYAPRRIRLADPSLANLRVSGTFSVSDAGAFARAVTQVFPLRITEDADTIVFHSAPDKERTQ